MAKEPRHELARLALAQLYEAENQNAVAAELFRPLAEAHPENGVIVAGFAQSLRKLGQLTQAKAILEPLASASDALSISVVEMAQIEAELGDYAAARNWFDRAAPSSMTKDDAVVGAGISLSMLGDTLAADQVFSWMFEDKSIDGHSNDLKAHLAVNPQDHQAAEQLHRTVEAIAAQPPDLNPFQVALREATTELRQAAPGQRLYLQHCSSCHGTTGDGLGPAARHVFPQPRNLLNEPMRLVSSQNGIPRSSDIRTIIKEGIPGTSMVPMDTLSNQDIDLLVDVVLQLRRDGIRQQYIAQLQEDGEPLDEDDINEVVELRTTPGDPVVPPDMGAPTTRP